MRLELRTQIVIYCALVLFVSVPNVIRVIYRTPTSLHAKHCLDFSMGDEDAVALALVIGELKDLTTLQINLNSKIHP